MQRASLSCFRTATTCLTSPPGCLSTPFSTAKHWGADFEPIPVDLKDFAYLLFTSGSTGRPKGVGVTHANATAFLHAVGERYDFGPDDRFSQTFDMTFDLSVFDMFVAWSAGGCLCVPTQRQLIKPGRFIEDHELTVWFSVPSTGVFMRRLGELKEGRYPSLRWSLFCGEPLPVAVADAWARAAPASTVENLYGPPKRRSPVRSTAGGLADRLTKRCKASCRSGSPSRER